MEITRIGPYRLEEELGSGGMGVVYRAHDERLDRPVAVKLIKPDKSLDPKARERFRREARASARLSHPAIVQTYDLIETEEADAIVLELVAGISLASLLAAGPVELPQALSLAREIAEALAEAHGKGIIHRDLKAENVFVTPSGHAKVLDFGLAKHLDQTSTQLTADGVVLGTCRAMSPEQAQGQEVDHRADLFSFGTLLYELVTGQSPFLGQTAAATLWLVCSHRPKPVRALNPQVPEKLSGLIQNLLEKQPLLRPVSAQSVADTLAAIAVGYRPAALPAGNRHEAELSTWVDEETGVTVQVSGERRQVTVMQGEIVQADGSPPSPDDLHSLWTLAAEILQRLGGNLRPLAAQGFLGYFGYPQAHEDDVRRAIRAALEIADRVRGFSPTAGEPLRVKIGIHAGHALISRTSDAEADLALGDTPNAAALLRQLAPPDTVLISSAAHGLSQGFFQCEALEPISLPEGEPARIYRVVSDSGAHSRIEVASSLTPLVARDQELGLLLSRWALAREGNGQVALVAGEAGLGKSRLVWELRSRVVADGAPWLEAWASPFHGGSAFYSVLQWLHQWLGMDRQEEPDVQLARLEEALSHHGLPLAEAVPLLAALLAIPTGERYALPQLSPDARRRKTLEALLAVLFAAAERQPLPLVMEDLHWSDPSSVDLLGLLIEHIPGFPILLVLTFRPEFQPLWGERSYLARLTLSPLTRAQARLMVDRLAEEQGLDPAVRDQVAARTDGVPLFIEELTRMILESGNGGVPENGEVRSGAKRSLEIPATLEGWLRARLDRLDTAREVAQVAAVLGRAFSFDLLRAISPWSDTVLELELNRLIEAEILYRRGFGLKYQYVFKHALLQDAAYAFLVPAERRKYHQRTAEALERGFAGTARTHPELVAHHYTEAGLLEKALPFWQRAGEGAFAASAFAETADYLARTIEVLHDLPESIERDRQEMMLQVTLAEARGCHLSHAAPEVQGALSRALELCSQAGERRQRLELQLVLIASYMVGGQARQAVELAWQAHELACLEGDPVLQNSACQRLGFPLLTHGELAAARRILEEGLNLWIDPGDVRVAATNDRVNCEVTYAWVLSMLGHLKQAAQHCREALHKAGQIPSPYTTGFVQFFASLVFSLTGDWETVGELGERELLLGRESSLLLWEAGGGFFQACAAFQRTGDPAHLSAMEENLGKYIGHGSLCVVPHLLALLAEGYLRAGRPAEALAAVDKGFSVSRQGEQVFFDAELSRLRGEAVLAGEGPVEEAEPLFQQALDVARRQGARSLELRAALSLARHWNRQDRRNEARDLLAGVHGTFDEGFETPDLREARALLTELG